MINAPAALIAALLAAAQVQQPAAPVIADENVTAVREAVQRYYDAQAARDPDAALAFWSASALPRPTRDAFVAVFGEPAEDSFTVDVRSVEIKGAEARVRVAAARTRLIMRNGSPVTQRMVFQNAQLWRKESGLWKLLRDGPYTDAIADELIAAAASERPALYDKYRADLVQTRLAISQRATMAITVGRDYMRGKSLFELALEVARIARDRPGEANSLHNIAQALFFLRDLPAATEHYEKELAVAREIDDQDIAAAAFFGLATVAYTRAEYTPALGFYREALAVYEKRDDGAAMGRAVVSIGNVQYLQGEYDTAIASYRRALGLQLTAQDAQGASFAKTGLARVFAAQGDLAAALDMYGQVLADARATNARETSKIAATLESIGEIYFRLGNTDQARTTFQEARTLYQADPGSVGRTSGSLGLTELVAGRFDAALAAYTESRARYEQAQQPDGVARAWVGIGFSHGAREKFAEAMTAYRTAIRMFDEQNLPEDAARAWLGLSMAQSGALDDEAALASATKVRDAADKLKNQDLAWRAATRAGEALRKLGRFDAARQEFQRAIGVIEQLTAVLPINPDVRAQIDDSASAWSGLALTLAASGTPREALAALEARRAHIRRVHLASFQRDITRGMTDAERADEQSIVRELISTRAQLRAESGLRRGDQARIDRLQQQLTTLLARRGEQQTKLYERLPALREERGLTPAQAEKYSLPGDRALAVEYLVGDDELLIVTMARGEDGPDIAATVVPCKRRELGEQIAQAMQQPALNDAAEWRKRAAPLAAAVLAPITGRLASRDSYVIIPDDLLWKIPFEALPAGEAALGARARVTYGTSFATLGRQQDIAAGRRPHESVSAALFAAPVVPQAVRNQLTLAQAGWKEPDAESALRSATELSRLYGDSGTVKSGADATEAAARAAMANADVMQFAGPLQMSGATPLFSMVVLGGDGESSDNDGRWEVREWFTGTSPARVIVLADGASFGAAGTGGAMDTMAWAAASLGAPALLLGRWPADGFASNAVLAAFHAGLAKGMSPADAWSAAVSAARAKTAAPAAWSGLRLLGPG